MGVHVSLEILLGVKDFAATRLLRALVFVPPFMVPLHVARRAETFAAHIALVRLLPGVGSHVDPQSSPGGEDLQADLALGTVDDWGLHLVIRRLPLLVIGG